MRALFWTASALLAWTQAGYGLFLAALRRLGAPAWSAPAPGRRAAARDADRGRPPRAGGDRGEGRERAVARLAARASRGDRRGRRRGRAGRRRDRRARPRGRCGRRARAAARAARSAPRTPPSRSRRASCWRSRTPTRCGSRTRCCDAGRRVRGPGGRLRLRPGAVRQRRRDEPGGRLLALRDVAARARVGARLGHGRQRRDLRGAADAYLRLDPRTSHDLSFPFNLVKRGWRAVYEPAARATERTVPTIEGELAPQAADDEPRLADRRARRDARPARLPAAVRAEIVSHRLLRYATPFLHVLARAGDARAARPRAPSTRSPRPSRARVLVAAARRRSLARAAAAGRALLRAHDRLARRRPVGLAAPRHAGGWDAPEGTR